MSQPVSSAFRPLLAIRYGSTGDELVLQLRSAPDAHDPVTGRQVIPRLASLDAALWLCGSGLTVYKLIIHSVQSEITKFVSEANTYFYRAKVAASTSCGELFSLTGNLRHVYG